MKLLLVSINSIHITRWLDQLKSSGYDVYWFNVNGIGTNSKLPWINQITNWKLKWDYPGRIFIKKRLPKLYAYIERFNTNNIEKVFEECLKIINPDVVHSFALYLSCTPILNVMMKYQDIPWIYSSWGSDLYYFKNIPKYKTDIKKVLPRMNYLMTDCKRDVNLAKTLGFKGEVLGVFPGGGGFNYGNVNAFIKPVSKRNIILIKGYQGRSGRAITVLKALQLIENELKEYEVIIFSTDNEVIEFIEENKLFKILNLSIFKRSQFLPHKEILKLMGKALIYIGNSNSDGMPNTLLEAIAMGAFPIQSNPGGATAEVINAGENGFLINDCEDSIEIKDLILKTLSSSNLFQKAFDYNQFKVKPKYAAEKIKKEVLIAYKSVFK